MGEHKERTGKTRVGKFLQGVKDVAPEILQFAGQVTGIEQLENLGKMIDKDPNISEYDKETARQFLEMDRQEMTEITERWKADMTSDSWLSKNIRPLALATLTVFILFIMFTDSKTEWSFDVKTEYIDLMKSLLITVYVAYFGSRGYEKGQKMRLKRKS